MSKESRLGFSTIELLIILIIAVILGGFVASKYTPVAQQRRDDQRKKDVNSLQLAIQSYWAQTGKFPSYTQLNSPGFRKTSLNNLSSDFVREPRWSAKNKLCSFDGQPSFQNSDTPATGCYGYTVLPVDCDNNKTDCAGYSLNARLEAGGFYNKSGS